MSHGWETLRGLKYSQTGDTCDHAGHVAPFFERVTFKLHTRREFLARKKNTNDNSI